MFPSRAGKSVFCVKAAVLGGHGSSTPFLLSKELMRKLGVVLGMSTDESLFRSLNERVKMSETQRGQYSTPLCEDSHCCPRRSAM